MPTFRTQIEGLPVTRLRPILLSDNRSSRTYQMVASDEVELKSDYKATSYQNLRLPAYKNHPQLVQSRSESFWRNTWNDLKCVPWARFASHSTLLILVVFLILMIFLMSVSPLTLINDNGGFCKPDGKFMLSWGPYNPWRLGSFFAISIKFGRYPFEIAKLIDVCWDVGVGRGGQALLALIAYRIFTKGLTRTMEASSVSHTTFTAITLQNDTAMGTFMLIWDFFKTGGCRAKAAMLWTILASLFVLTVPTWLSAMTGYTADMQSMILHEDAWIDASNFRPVIYVIHDGARLGGDMKNDTRFSVPWPHAGRRLSGCNNFGCDSLMAVFNQSGEGKIQFKRRASYIWEVGASPSMDLDCKWLWAISKYVADHGLLASSTAAHTTFHQPDSSDFTTARTFSPPLNVSAHFILPSAPGSSPTYYYDSNTATYYYYVAGEWNACPYGREWVNPIDGRLTFNDSRPLLWDTDSNISYTNVTEFTENGTCQQPKELVKYQWGFSFILLYVFAITFLVWTLGMWAFYLDSWLHSRLDVSERRIGLERAVLDISESMLSRVDVNDVKLQGNSQLQTLAKPNMLTYSDLPISETTTRWTEYKRWWRYELKFKQWVRDEKWWLCAMLLFDVLLVWSFVKPILLVWCPFVSTLPGLGVFFVLALGRGTRGRWVVFVFWFLVFWSVNTWWIIVTSRYW